MKKCRYCGRENDNNLVKCWECGTDLPERSEHATPPPLPKSHRKRIDDPLRAYMRRSAKETLIEAPSLRCKCSGVMNAYYVNKSFLGALVPMGHSTRYRCQLCDSQVALKSPIELFIFGFLGVMLFCAAIPASKDTWTAGDIIGSGVMLCIAIGCLYSVYSNILNRFVYRKV